MHPRSTRVLGVTLLTALSFSLAAAFALAASGCAHEDAMPPLVSAELERTPRGEVTVVEFVDFECPFCRGMNADLSPVLAAHTGHIRVVRKQIPLIAIHPHALAAARASICGEEQGKGDAMAEALFQAPLEDLTDGGCMALASRVGLDPDRFTACYDAEGTLARIKADVADFEAAQGGGVPTVWVDGHVFVGEYSAETMKSAVEGALRDDE